MGFRTAEYEEMIAWAEKAFPDLMAEIARAQVANDEASAPHHQAIQTAWIQRCGGFDRLSDEGEFDRMMEWAALALPEEWAALERLLVDMAATVGHLVRSITAAWHMHRAGALAIAIAAEIPTRQH